MGNWQLEVGKMMMYMAFPVVMFHYFNQPHIYEKYIVEKKREIYPMRNKADDERLKEVVRQIRDRQEAKAAKEMEGS